jgi:hypothetical protein
MCTIEELKGKWSASANIQSGHLGAEELTNVFRRRVKTKFKSSMQYFWASFTLQLLVYGLLTHVVVRYWLDPAYMAYAVCGILLYIPFTIVLMRKFKAIAVAKPQSHTTASLYQYADFHYAQLASFYKFKKWYEIILIPISVAIGTILTFNLFVPGGVSEHLNGALITFILSLLSCFYAIVRENRRSFEGPLRELENILKEFKSDSTSD